MDKTAFYFAAAIVIGVGGFSLYKFKYEEWILIPEARKTLQSKLRDPDSAQFRNERITNAGVLCGEVNAKNGLGGYVGFKKYFAHAEANYVEGIGSLDKETHKEMMLRLDKQIALLKSYNQLKKDFPDMQVPSNEQIAEQAAEEVVKDQFQAKCDA